MKLLHVNDFFSVQFTRKCIRFFTIKDLVIYLSLPKYKVKSDSTMITKSNFVLVAVKI